MPSRTVEQLRRAVVAGDSLKSACLLEDFRVEAENSWRAAPSVEARQQIAGEVMDLLQWARATVMASRSHQQGKLLQFNRVSAYLGAGAAKCDQLDLDA
jgi:hypothetical protein